MSLRTKLLERYQDLHRVNGWPAWAFQVVPPTPLVGQDYVRGEGLLVYGSAENLSKGRVKVAAAEKWERHREHLEQWKREGAAGFPHMHCKPIQDGGLLVAAAFVLSISGRPVNRSRAAFIEAIAVGNVGKFAIAAHPNKDYAGNGLKLADSVPFLQADLELLQPSILFLPKSAWGGIGNELRPYLKGTRIVAAYQCQPRVINVHLGTNYDGRAHELASQYQDAPWKYWFGDLARSLKRGMWRYLAHVEEAWVRGPSWS